MKELWFDGYKKFNDMKLVIGKEDKEREQLIQYDILNVLLQRKSAILLDFTGHFLPFAKEVDANVIHVKDGTNINPLDFHFAKQDESHFLFKYRSDGIQHVLRNVDFLDSLYESFGEPRLSSNEAKKRIFLEMYNKSSGEESADTWLKDIPSLKDDVASFESIKHLQEEFIQLFPSKETNIKPIGNRLTVFNFQEVKAHKEVIVHAYLEYIKCFLRKSDQTYAVFFDDYSFIERESPVQTIIKSFCRLYRFTRSYTRMFSASSFEKIYLTYPMTYHYDSIFFGLSHSDEVFIIENEYRSTDEELTPEDLDIRVKSKNEAYCCFHVYEQDCTSTCVIDFTEPFQEIPILIEYLNKVSQIESGMVKSVEGNVKRLSSTYLAVVKPSVPFEIDGYPLEEWLSNGLEMNIETINPVEDKGGKR